MSIFTKDKLDALNNYACQPKADFVKKNNFLCSEIADERFDYEQLT